MASSSSSSTTSTAGAPGTTGDIQPVHKNPIVASNKCQQWVDSGLQKNRTIQFLLQTLVDLGCLERPSEANSNNKSAGFIHCHACEHPAAGRFNMIREELPSSSSSSCKAVQTSLQKLQRESLQQPPESTGPGGDSMATSTATSVLKPEIEVCQQYMSDESMTHKTIIHELVHAIDLCRVKKMDPVNNCLHMACTEVRAENLSGECNFWSEVMRGQASPLTPNRNAGHGQECVRRRAALSVRANPKCAAQASDYVNAAMSKCYQDVYPFDRHPRQQPYFLPFQKSKEERPGAPAAPPAEGSASSTASSEV